MDNSYIESPTLLEIQGSGHIGLSAIDELKQNWSKFLKILKNYLRIGEFFFYNYHRIPLEVGAGPGNITPYRNLLEQRDIIEELIQEMLERGIIHNSFCPFASTVVLIEKKMGHGGWKISFSFLMS